MAPFPGITPAIKGAHSSGSNPHLAPKTSHRFFGRKAQRQDRPKAMGMVAAPFARAHNTYVKVISTSPPSLEPPFPRPPRSALQRS